MADIFVIVYDENRPSLVKYTNLYLFNRPTDETQVLPTQPETNTNFIAGFQPTLLRPYRPWRSDAEVGIQGPQPETNQFFVAKFQPAQLRQVPYYLRQDSSGEQALPTQPETNTNFIAQFQPSSVVSPLALRQVPAGDVPPFVQPETNTNFIAQFQPVTILSSLALRQFISTDFPTVVQAETNTSFLARFTYTSLRTYAYHLRADCELSGPQQTQAETNTNFVAILQSTQRLQMFQYNSRPTDEGSVTPAAGVFQYITSMGGIFNPGSNQIG